MICALVLQSDQAPRATRRARLLAARGRAVRSINRKAIVNGEWDSGSVVRSFMAMAKPESDLNGEAVSPPTKTET
jgi:hypothetical protein